METIASYFLKAILASGVLYAYYHFVLRNKKFHTYNRVYLLLSLAVSGVVPFVSVDWMVAESSTHPSIARVVQNINTPLIENSAPINNRAIMGVFCIAAVISLSLLTLLLSRVIWIYRVRRNGRHTRMPGFTLVETNVPEAPFSFLDNLFWRGEFPASDSNNARILEHELTHIRHKHSYDKLFAQVICCLCWINPFYWLIQKELNAIHEFVADASAIDQGDTASFAAMLLQSYNDGRYLSPGLPFFNSSIKRRLIMISAQNKTRYSYAKRILVLPVALSLIFLLTVDIRAQHGPGKKIINSTYVDTVPLYLEDTLKPVKNGDNPIGDRAIKAPVAEPVTVTGHKLEKAPSAGTITVTGKKTGGKSKLAPVAVVGEPSGPGGSPEPVAVIAHQTGETPEPAPVVVVGYKTDRPPVPAVVTVVGVSKANSAPEPVNVVGQKSPQKPSPEPVTVTGYKVEKAPEKNQ